MITITEYCNKAVDFILEQNKGTDNICKELRKNPVEDVVCSRRCQGLDEFCVKRLLKHYKPNKP